jgi:hypothetical protein
MDKEKHKHRKPKRTPGIKGATPPRNKRDATAGILPVLQSYTDSLAQELCSRMVLGETVHDIVKDAHMPTKMTIWKWRQIQG